MNDLPSGNDLSPQRRPGNGGRRRYILRATAGYALFATLWIFLSDRLLVGLVNLAEVNWLSTAKGLFFVTVTTLLLLAALRGVPGKGGTEPAAPRLEALLALSTRGKGWIYLFAVLASAAMLLVRSGIAVPFPERPLLILFMFPVILSATAGGLGPGLVATAIAALGAAYCTPPSGSFHIAAGHDLFQWGFLVADGVLVSVLAEVLHRSRRQTEADRQLQAVTLASIGDGVIATDTRGIVTFLNPEAERLTGWSCREAKGQPLSAVFRVIDEKNRQPIDDPVHTVLTTGNAVGLANHTLLIRRDGRELPVVDSGAPIRLNDKTLLGVVLVFRDDTRRRQAEKALQQERGFLKTIIQTLPDLVWLKDQDGVYLACNPRFERFFGASEAEIVGKTDYDFVTRELADFFRQKDNEAIAKGGPSVNQEEVTYAVDGHRETLETIKTPMYDSQGQLIGVLGIARDITAACKAEEALRARDELLRDVSAMAHIGGWSFDPATGRGSWTEEVARIHEVDPARETTVQYGIGFYAPGESREKIAAAVQAASEQGTPYDLELELITARGKRRWVRTMGRPEMENGRVVRVRGALQDITSRKTLENQLHHAQKLESIGRLAGGVAHDFNNMLMVISGYTEIALRETPAENPHHAGLLEIHAAASRSAVLTRQLLTFARKQAIHPVVLDINDTVEGTLKMLRRLIGEDIDLAWGPGSGLWQVRIDPTQIDQLLANLAVNARDAIAGVGTIAIETANTVLSEADCAGQQGVAPGEYVTIEMRDNGSGMGPEVLEHIFEPFFTTKEDGKGTGLGLATVYGIVKQNNGAIEVTSAPGRGTSFRIHLPRFVERHEAGTSRQTEEEPLPRGTETVLFVEDEGSILNLGRQFLERLGYRVLTAAMPEEAIRLVENSGETIHLLITDVVMPTMNGKELAERLRQMRLELKCLFISGYPANVIDTHGVLAEGIHFLQKPFSLRDLAFKAREALAG
ncbi:MAG: PAS domain S-box protein [Thermodesulfobacteriota bacterium]